MVTPGTGWGQVAAPVAIIPIDPLGTAVLTAIITGISMPDNESMTFIHTNFKVRS